MQFFMHRWSTKIILYWKLPDFYSIEFQFHSKEAVYCFHVYFLLHGITATKTYFKPKYRNEILMADETNNALYFQYEDIDMTNVYECYEGGSQLQNQETFNDQGLEDFTEFSFYDVYESDGHDAAEAKKMERSSSEFCQHSHSSLVNKSSFYFVGSDADVVSEVSIIEWEDSEDISLFDFPESNCDNIEAVAKAQRSSSEFRQHSHACLIS